MRFLRIFFIVTSCFIPSTYAWDTQVLLENQRFNRIHLVLLADGFTEASMNQYDQSANAVKSKFLPQGGDPFLSSYGGLFSVTSVKAVSKQDGITGDPPGSVFESAYGTKVVSSALTGFDDAPLSSALSHVPHVSLAMIIANTRGVGVRSTGGTVARIKKLFFTGEIAHELGHTLGGLADEYVDPTYQSGVTCDEECPEVNVTPVSDPNQVKWSYWISPKHPEVGLFEGARYLPKGVFRPKAQCRMRHHTTSPFCEVCTEKMILSFWKRVRPIDSVEPPPGGVDGLGETPLTFEVKAPKVSLKFEWFLDGLLVQTGGNKFSFTPKANALGRQTLKVKVTDSNLGTLVLRDPDHLLEDTRQWIIQVPIAEGCVCEQDDRPIPDNVLYPSANPALARLCTIKFRTHHPEGNNGFDRLLSAYYLLCDNKHGKGPLAPNFDPGVPSSESLAPQPNGRAGTKLCNSLLLDAQIQNKCADGYVLNLNSSVTHGSSYGHASTVMNPADPTGRYARPTACFCQPHIPPGVPPSYTADQCAMILPDKSEILTPLEPGDPNCSKTCLKASLNHPGVCR